MRKSAAMSVLVFAIGCSSVPTGYPRLSKGSVSISEITPRPGSLVDRNTSLHAVVLYTVDTLREGIEYFLVPQFDSGTDRQSFNMLDSFDDAPRVSTTSGALTIDYPIQREWDSGKLKRPVKIWFVLMQRVERHKTRVIASTNPIEFLTHDGA